MKNDDCYLIPISPYDYHLQRKSDSPDQPFTKIEIAVIILHLENIRLRKQNKALLDNPFIKLILLIKHKLRG